MKRAALIMISLVLTIALLLPVLPASAQSTSATWSSAIVYGNPTDFTDCTLEVAYINSGASGVTPVLTTATIPVAAHGSGELLIGSLGATLTDFTGSAVVSSNCPLSAVYRQFAAQTSAANSTAYSPVLYEAFTGDQAGKTFFLPTFMRSASQFSQVGIQNISDFDVKATATFRNSTLAVPADFIVPAKGSRVFTSAEFPGLPASFDGSLTISAVENVTSSPRDGQIVVSSQELQTSGRRAYAFVGVKQGAQKLYMPAALCNVGTTRQTSYYAVQNAGAAAATVYVEYRTNEGVLITRHTAGIVLPGKKVNTNACQARNMAGKSGVAVIYAKEIVDGAPKGPLAPLAVVGKVTSTDGLATAFTGQPAGATALTLPYVRWGASSTDRSYISIMNAGGGPATVTVKYYGINGGAPLKTQTFSNIPVNGKRSSNPSTFAGSLAGGVYVGAVEITSNMPVVALVRTQKTTTITGYKTLGEDYTGMAILQP